MKAVAVIRGIYDETAILKNNPIFRAVAAGNVDNCGPKNSNGNDCAYTNSREDRKPKDQSGTSNWLMR
jgi:hypothetical protein